MKRAEREGRQKESLAYLRKMLPPGKEVYASVVHVSRSGMQRTIKLYVVAKDGRGKGVIAWVPSPRIADLLDWATDDKKRDGSSVQGAGMDMTFKLTYELSRKLWGHLPAERIRYKLTEMGSGNREDPGYLLTTRRL